MKSLLLSGLFGLLMYCGLHATGPIAPQYPIEDIPEALTTHADAVIRRYDTRLIVKNDRKADREVTFAISILNEEAARQGLLVLPYDKFDRIVSVSGQLFDANGKFLQKLKKDDQEDISGNQGGGTFASDNRLLISGFNHNNYPYTVEYTYKIAYRGLFSYPRWMPIDEEKLSLEAASLEIVMDEPDEVRFKSDNLEVEPTSAMEKGKHLLRWELGNHAAQESEAYGPDWSALVPVIYLAPRQFKIEGYEGKTESWEDFGKFIYTLNNDRQELPPALAAKVHAIADPIPDTLGKITALYQFLQEQNRYVSIQLGLGGWQTYDAAYVYENGYGDCKALSNYMRSLLQEVGIPAYQALIFSGTSRVPRLKDFPSNQFNHVVLHVPLGPDSLWLECTQKNFPPGYLGHFNENRYALICTPEGGKLVSAPDSRPVGNQQIRHTSVWLDPKGHATVETQLTLTGFQQLTPRELGESASTEDQANWLRRRIQAGSFDLQEYAFEARPAADFPTYQISYQAEAKNWSKSSGTRMFLMPNILERQRGIPEKMEDRKQDVVMDLPYLDTDSITYHLPPGYLIESQSNFPVQIETEFATYEADLTVIDEQTLLYTRKLQVERITLPPSYYEQMRNFWKKVAKADKSQIVLSNKS